MRVLVIEDSVRLRGSIETALRRSGYAVDGAGDGLEGVSLAQAAAYDAVVLDIMLPGLDGLGVLRRLRDAKNDVHVLLLTARDTVTDRVQGLNAGADDYLVKPFALEELLARVAALCRRTYGRKAILLIVGDIEIDTQAREAARGGRPIPLKPREFGLLEYLARREGEVVTRREIEAHLYDSRLDAGSNVVESAVSILRRHLADAGAPQLIHTRHGVGYVLRAESPASEDGE